MKQSHNAAKIEIVAMKYFFSFFKKLKNLRNEKKFKIPHKTVMN